MAKNPDWKSYILNMERSAFDEMQGVANELDLPVSEFIRLAVREKIDRLSNDRDTALLLQTYTASNERGKDWLMNAASMAARNKSFMA